jgi:hypothetical protein
MKNLLGYKIFESKDPRITPEQIKFLNRHVYGEWDINEATGLIDVVNGYVELNGKKMSDFMGIEFGRIDQHFSIEGNLFENLKGAPREVGGSFYCESNLLTSLEGAPEKVGGGFYCDNNKLKSLKGAPVEVGGNFFCGDNELTSLEGAPERVGDSFYCNDNQLTSLEGAPEKVGDSFYCNDNQLTSLEGAPVIVGSTFNCTGNPLETLNGLPQKIGAIFKFGSASISGNKLNTEEILDVIDRFNPIQANVPIKKLIVDLLFNTDLINSKIEKDPDGMIQILRKIWDDPYFADIKKSIKFPKEYGDVDKFISSMNRLDRIKYEI